MGVDFKLAYGCKNQSGQAYIENDFNNAAPIFCCKDFKQFKQVANQE